MKLNNKIIKFINDNGGILKTSDFISLGYSKTTLANYLNAGLLNKVAQGIYVLPKIKVCKYYELTFHSKLMVFSHESALYLNKLIVIEPKKYSITIPKNTMLTPYVKNKCNCFYVKPEVYELGIYGVKTPMNRIVACYDHERTICDLLRSEKRVGENILIKALKNYAKWRGKDLDKLYDYAKKFRIFTELRRYMKLLV